MEPVKQCRDDGRIKYVCVKRLEKILLALKPYSIINYHGHISMANAVKVNINRTKKGNVTYLKTWNFNVKFNELVSYIITTAVLF